MKLFNRTTCTILILALTIFIMTACAESTASQSSGSSASTSQGSTTVTSSNDKSTKLTFVNWGSAEDATKPAFDAMCNEFTKKNPSITIEQVAYPYNSIKDQLLIMSSGGNAPDLAQVKGEWVVSLYNANTLANLGEMLPKATIDDYYPGLLAGATYNGKLVSAPWAPSPVLMYYNKTLLKAAGYENPPKTWAELIEQADKISKLGNDAAGNRIYGLGVSSKKLAGAGYFFLINMWQHGGDFINEKGEIVLDSANNIEAFSEIKSLIQNKVVPEGLEIKELRNLFAQGQLGFIFDLEVGYGIFDKGSSKGTDFEKEYAATYIPGIDNAQGQTFAVEHQLVAFESSNNKEATAKLIDFLTGPNGIAIYNANGGGKLPARKSVAELDYYKLPENQKLLPFSSSLAFAKSLPSANENFLSACEDVADAIQRVSLNNEDPSTVVKNLAQTVSDKYTK